MGSKLDPFVAQTDILNTLLFIRLSLEAHVNLVARSGHRNESFRNISVIITVFPRIVSSLE